MEVYIEYAIIDNLVMDYLLLNTACILCKVKTKRYLVILAAAIGCAAAVILPLFTLVAWAYILIKICLAALMCLITAKFDSIFQYIKLLNAFVLMTFVVGGSVYGLLSIFEIMPKNGGYYRGEILPVGLSFLLGYILFILVKRAVEYYFDKALKMQYCDCIIKINSRQIKLKAFFDSGNFLKDAISGLPIVVCNKSSARKIMWLSESPPITRQMNISTASGSGTVLIVDIDSITVKLPNGFNKTSNAMLGILMNNNIKLDADLIIGTALI